VLYTTADNSVIDGRGRIIFFSIRRFISDVSEGNCCFVCGAPAGTVPFNDEHILPDWILKRFSLHNKTIVLPNGTRFRYGEYTVPCCSECNSAMGRKFEQPLSEMFANGQKALSHELKQEGPYRLFCWMALIFLKTHLRDKNLKLHRDARKGHATIGELHSWEDLHHAHCVARAFYTGCELTPEVIGSVLVVPSKVRPHFDNFDYGDFSFAQTMLLRMNDTAIFTVLNDSGATLTIVRERLEPIEGPLSPLQVREIAADLASVNVQLVERPTFSSEFNYLTEEYRMLAHRPHEWSLDGWEDEIRGEIMHHLCSDYLNSIPNGNQILPLLRTGRYTFLVDDQGKFAHDHMELQS